MRLKGFHPWLSPFSKMEVFWSSQMRMARHDVAFWKEMYRTALAEDNAKAKYIAKLEKRIIKLEGKLYGSKKAKV